LIAFDSALTPVYRIADINYSCFVGGQEAYEVGGKYLTIFSDPMTVVLNMGFNFGLIFNAVKEVVTFFIYPKRCNSDTAFEFGVQIGSFFFNILANH